MRNRAIQLVGGAAASAFALDFAFLQQIGVCLLGVTLQMVLGISAMAQPAQAESSQQPALIDEAKGTVTPFPPHVMFYGPYMTNADIGSDGNPSGPAFVVGEGSPHALMIVPLGTHASHTEGNKSPGGSK